MAHGDLAPDAGARTLVVVFGSPVGEYLLHFGRDLGFHTVLVDPQPRRAEGVRHHADAVVGRIAAYDGPLDDADIVVTDHDRPELGELLRDALAAKPRWVGVMGSPRHAPPHVDALRGLGVAEEDIARVHRPIGLNIGSRTPPEIAVATLAGLIAERNERPGGFVHAASR